MHAHGYDENGFYVGVVPRQPNPLEPGVWLMPANATAKEPPACPNGKRLVFKVAAQEWAIEDAPQEAES